MPSFSVVIPLYNKEKFVEKTLQSVLSQTFTDYEVIVIDDCSTDASLEVVNRISNAAIKVIRHEQNKGLSASRNTGIQNALSQYIAFIDADDTWEPNFLEKMHDLIGKFPEAGIYASGYDEKYPGGRALEVHKNIDFAPGEMNTVADFFKANAHQPIFCYSSAVIRRDVFEKAGYFDEKITYGEDTDFNIRAAQQFEFAYYNAIGASYTMDSENQITRSSIGNKTVTDFNKYEADASENPWLKKYLDFNRYILAIEYKLSGFDGRFRQLVAEIDAKNLTNRQQFIVKAPIMIVKLLRKVKRSLLQKGIRLTTFKK